MFLADSVHYSHPRFRLRVPPRGPPHLHRAPEVSRPPSPRICQRIGAERGSYATFSLQPIEGEDAESVQHLHLCHVHYVLSGSSLWLPDF